MSKSITQDMAYQAIPNEVRRESTASAAPAGKYNKSRSYIYFWKQRWDGSVASLACQSRRPHSHPNQHTEAELKLIRDMRRRNPSLGMIELWHRLRKRGYTRCPESLFRVMRKTGAVSGRKAQKSVQAKALRADDLSRPARAGGCQGRSAPLYCRPGASPVPVHRHRRVHEAALSWRPTRSSPPIPRRTSCAG